MGKLLDQTLASAQNRRRFLNRMTTAGVMAAAASQLPSALGQSSTPSDADILNFALNLEYLEAEFYTFATAGTSIDKLGIGIDGSGTAGATTGGSRVDFGTTPTNPPTANPIPLTASTMSAAIAREIAFDERAHVTYIRTALMQAGATPIAKPAINLNALMLGFSGITDFLQLARVFEDIGVTAYAAAAPLISSKTILGAAARIAQTEAEHAANIRLQIAQLGIPTAPLDGVDILPPPSGSKYFSVDNNALTQVRTPGQVLYLAYGNQANVTAGGFFPSGVNGTLNMSSGPASIMPVNGTTAVLATVPSETNQTAITLDASGSQSGAGNLTYLFMVVPGGLQPALLQSPNNPKATVEFVNGPGTYIVELQVTDAKGNVATSAPVSILYKP